MERLVFRVWYQVFSSIIVEVLTFAFNVKVQLGDIHWIKLA